MTKPLIDREPKTQVQNHNQLGGHFLSKKTTPKLNLNSRLFSLDLQFFNNGEKNYKEKNDSALWLCLIGYSLGTIVLCLNLLKNLKRRK